MIGKAILGGSILGMALAKVADEIPGMTMVERYGVLGLLAWMVIWQARRAVAAQDATSALVRECVTEQRNLARQVEQFCAVSSQAHQDYEKRRTEAVAELKSAISEANKPIVDNIQRTHTLLEDIKRQKE